MVTTENVRVVLFVATFCAVFFSQITYQSSVRISMPFRYVEIMVLAFLILSSMTIAVSKIKTSYASVFFYISLFLVTVQSWVVGRDLYLQGNVPYFIFSVYVLLHSVSVFYLFSQFRSLNSEKIHKWLIGILLFHLIVSFHLYVFHLIGLNSIKLGINYHSINIPRLMGLVAEPSHYSIIAWITAYWSYIYFGKKSIITVLSFVAFIVSFSTTGIIFFLLTLLFLLLKDFRIDRFIYVAIFLVLLSVWMPDEYYSRYISRIGDEISLLITLASGESSSTLLNVQSNSRATVIEAAIVYLQSYFPSYLVGYGAGGQVLLISALGNIFDGLIYILFEFGIVGLLIVSYFIIKIYRATSKNYQPLFLAYLVISFFNAPGGNFGIDFIFILLIVYMLSNTVNKQTAFILPAK